MSGKEISLEEARAKMGGEYLMNAEASTLEVQHGELERISKESAFKSKCPACSDGILLVGRDGETFLLLERDYCIVCAQSVKYLDIDELNAQWIGK